MLEKGGEQSAEIFFSYGKIHHSTTVLLSININGSNVWLKFQRKYFTHSFQYYISSDWLEVPAICRAEKPVAVPFVKMLWGREWGLPFWRQHTSSFSVVEERVCEIGKEGNNVKGHTSHKDHRGQVKVSA